MPLIDQIQTIHFVAQRLRQSGNHQEADLLEDAVNQIVDIVTHEIAIRERQIYECRRLRSEVESTSASSWKNLSEI